MTLAKTSVKFYWLVAITDMVRGMKVVAYLPAKFFLYKSLENPNLPAEQQKSLHILNFVAKVEWFRLFSDFRMESYTS